MNTYTNISGTAKITYPNGIFETRGKFAYIAVELLSPAENVEISLKLTNGEDENYQTVTLTRNTNYKGIVTFPIGLVCESLIERSGSNYIGWSVNIYGSTSSGGSIYAIKGFASQEITTVNNQDSQPYTNYPAAKKIVLYPNTSFDQTLFVPLTSDFYIIAGRTWDDKTTAIGATITPPYASFKPSLVDDDTYTKIIAKQSTASRAVDIPVYLDPCTSGVFLKWTDAAGMPYLYRWTQEVETDEVSVDSSYKQLDDTLTPYDVQTKTRAKRYTLHSRIVERGIFEMCRTILGAQEVFMYDPELSDWVRVLVEDAESEDTGAIMQDVEIEVVKYEYL